MGGGNRGNVSLGTSFIICIQHKTKSCPQLAKLSLVCPMLRIILTSTQNTRKCSTLTFCEVTIITLIMHYLYSYRQYFYQIATAKGHNSKGEERGNPQKRQPKPNQQQHKNKPTNQTKPKPTKNKPTKHTHTQNKTPKPNPDLYKPVCGRLQTQ